MRPVPRKDAPPALPLVAALKGQAAARPPFWLMRQAGRYLPEYRALREKAGSFLDLCYNPAFAAEVTLQPLRRFDMDAAIIFSDILVIPHALGQALDFVAGEGPRLGPLDIHRLRYDSARLAPVQAALSLVRSQLGADKALIGFAGAPWTVACYMVQGYGDGAFNSVTAFAREKPEDFSALIGLLTDVTADYLSAQIRSGADTVQIFDSWAGLLDAEEFARWVIAPTREIVRRVKQAHPETPVIGFPRGAGQLYARYASETGVDGLSLDQKADLSLVGAETGGTVCLQGNLDPAILLAGGEALQDNVLRLLSAMRGRPFIFNLGHGVIKETPPEHVAELARLVREFR